MPRKTKTKQNIDGKEEVEKKASNDVSPRSNTDIFAGKKNVRSIDELLGKSDNPYSAESYAAYEDRIKNLSVTELERHATEMGEFPTSNKTVLIKRLLARFEKLSGGYVNTLQYNSVQPKSADNLYKIVKKAQN